MAKSSKKLSKKVQKLVKSDLFTSIAIASILFNILALVGLFVLTNTETYDRSVYESVRSKYCKNIDGVVKRAKELNNSKKALTEWKVTCLSEEFSPYYKEAIEKFETSKSQ